MEETSPSSSQYILQPLLFPALPNLDSVNPSSPAATARAVRSVEGSQNYLYLGSSDGQVHMYRLSDQGSSNEPNHFHLIHSRSVSSANKPVERILLLEKVGIAVIQCESAVTFYSLPDFSSLDSTSSAFPRIKGVASVVLDDEEILKLGGMDGQGMISLCVVKRKSLLLLKCRNDGYRQIKETPIPVGVTLSKRYGDTLLFSDTSSYSLLNLSNDQLIPLGLPISQVTDSPTAQVKPSIVSIPCSTGVGCEFLITSHSTDMTLGVFIKPSGEPSPKLLEWKSHPRSLSYDSPNLISLLRDNTLEIHDLSMEDLSLSRKQVIHLPDLLEPRLLSSGMSLIRIEMDDGGGEFNLQKIEMELFSNAATLRIEEEKSSEKLQSSSPSPTRVILAGRNIVQAVCQPNFMIKAGRLLRRENWDELERLVAAEEMEVGIDEERPAPLLYFHHLIALYHLKALRFARAARHFVKAEADFRIVLRLLPDIWDADTVKTGPLSKLEVPRGLEKELLRWQTAEEMISRNLELNYAPALDVNTNPSILRLRRLLSRRSREMVRRVLDSSRKSSSTPSELRPLLETSLAKILCQDRESDEETPSSAADLSVGDLSRFTVAAHPLGELLVGLLTSKDCQCDMEILEPYLKEKGRWYGLGKWYEKEGRWEEMLEIWTKLIDGELSDADFEADPEENLEEVVRALEKSKDSNLSNRYGLWVTQRDAEKGIQILTKKTSKRLQQADETTHKSSSNSIEQLRTTLSQLHEIDLKAWEAVLESTVLSNKQQIPEFHMQLADLVLGRILEKLKDEGIRKAMLEIERDYTQGAYAESFVAHLALHAASAAPTDQKRSITEQSKAPIVDQVSSVSSAALERLKLAMILQGSNVLDPEKLLDKLEGEKLLGYERSILLGKLGRHKEALSLLALHLRDANSSEAYCSQAGAVLSPMLADTLAQEHGLKMYATLVSRGGKTSSKRKTGEENLEGDIEAKEDHTEKRQREKKQLIFTLLKVYMENGESGEKEHYFQVATAHLLNTQSLHLPPLDVLSLVPEKWSIKTLETFLSRSLRRSTHERLEGQLVANLALAQNLEVMEDSWAKMRSMGGILKEAEDDDGDDDDEDEVKGGSVEREDESGGGLEKVLVGSEVEEKEKVESRMPAQTQLVADKFESRQDGEQVRHVS